MSFVMFEWGSSRLKTGQLEDRLLGKYIGHKIETYVKLDYGLWMVSMRWRAEREGLGFI